MVPTTLVDLFNKREEEKNQHREKCVYEVETYLRSFPGLYKHIVRSVYNKNIQDQYTLQLQLTNLTEVQKYFVT